MRVSDLEKLEELITNYKSESDAKKKHVIYIHLIEESLKLVRNIVKTFYPIPSGVTCDDLIQVGAIGVLNAISSYKVEIKGSFKTYVSKIIRGKILHYLRDKANLVKPPRESVENFTKVKNIIEKLSQNGTKIPTTEEIAKLVRLPQNKVEEILSLEYNKIPLSLDDNIYNTEGFETLLDRLPENETSSFEDTFANKKILEDAIKQLPKVDKFVICKYYFEEAQRKEIAKELGVSPTQVSRILKRALNKLYLIMHNEISIV